MKFPRVDNFFGCMQLETGGLTIGWFHLVTNIMLFIIGLICFLLACVYNCNDFHVSTSEYGQITSTSDEYAFYCSFGQGLLFGLAIFLIVLSSIVCVISYYCIQGMKYRNPSHVQPMMILMAIGTVLSILEIGSMSLGSGLVKTILFGYLFVVMYSIWSLFKEEQERGVMTQYQPPNDDV